MDAILGELHVSDTDLRLMCMAMLEHPLLLLGSIVSQLPTGVLVRSILHSAKRGNNSR